MPIIVFLLLAFALFLYFRSKNANSSVNFEEIAENNQQVKIDQTSSFNNINIAYLSVGNLYCKNHDNNQIQEIQSDYIQKLIDRNEKKQQQHSWKEGTSWGTTTTGGVRDFNTENIDIYFTAAEILPDNKILYFLKGEGFGGLFHYDMASKKELRISHHQNLDYTDLCHDPIRKQILCTSNHNSGISNIVLMNEDGDASRELTSGDTEDISPCWLSNDKNQIVFQSMGLARSSEGFVLARGPASIQLLDTEKGELTPVLEDDNYDYIDPKVSKQGDLYFIRRPYETDQYKTSNIFMDTILFPFRLSRAIFHYLNFFSLIYSREPLSSSTSPYGEDDVEDILLKGRRINTEKALKKGHRILGVPSLAPQDWELICRNEVGEESILANSVSSYDLSDDNKIIYSNGYGVFSLENGTSSLIFKDILVSEVII